MENNEVVIEKYLIRYKTSPQSVSMRKSCLNHFFTYYGQDKSIFELTKQDISDYFDYLKTNKEYALNTKKAKFYIFRSFILRVVYYYEERFNKIPLFAPSYNWGDRGHADEKEKDYVLTPKNIEDILYVFDRENQIKYLVFGLYAFSGARKGEIQNLRIKGVNLEDRTITVKGKKGKKVYCFDERLLPKLEMYMNLRKSIPAETDHLFITTNNKAYSLRRFNMWLKPVLKELNLPNEVSIQYFRWSINNNRKELLDTPNDDCEVLLGHAISNVNSKHYTKKITPEKRAKLYDLNNPYKTIRI